MQTAWIRTTPYRPAASADNSSKFAIRERRRVSVCWDAFTSSYEEKFVPGIEVVIEAQIHLIALDVDAVTAGAVNAARPADEAIACGIQAIARLKVIRQR
jgi:hypothetical protein